jgi:hypothetical protein
MFFRSLATAACCVLLSTVGLAQTGAEKPDGRPLASPDATASVTLNGKAVTIRYNSPRVRSRKIMGDLVPYGQVWRTGANPATTLITATSLKIGTLDVPAGKYTLYTLPSETQ